MTFTAGLLVLLIGGGFISLAIFATYHFWRRSGIRKWLGLVGGLLLAAGGAGFFGNALAGLGYFRWLPITFEWPAGYASNVAMLPAHIYAVPLTPSGRIQLYDLDWRFLRGWWVDAKGGVFVVRPLALDKIEVITARANLRYVFALDGTLLSEETYSPKSYTDYPVTGGAYFIPTKWWLWPFSSPPCSWALGLLGGILLFLGDKVGSKKNRRRPQS